VKDESGTRVGISRKITKVFKTFVISLTIDDSIIHEYRIELPNAQVSDTTGDDSSTIV